MRVEKVEIGELGIRQPFQTLRQPLDFFLSLDGALLVRRLLALVATLLLGIIGALRLCSQDSRWVDEILEGTGGEGEVMDAGEGMEARV